MIANKKNESVKERRSIYIWPANQKKDTDYLQKMERNFTRVTELRDLLQLIDPPLIIVPIEIETLVTRENAINGGPQAVIVLYSKRYRRVIEKKILILKIKYIKDSSWKIKEEEDVISVLNNIIMWAEKEIMKQKEIIRR